MRPPLRCHEADFLVCQGIEISWRAQLFLDSFAGQQKSRLPLTRLKVPVRFPGSWSPRDLPDSLYGLPTLNADCA